MGECKAVNIAQLTANGNAMGQACDQDILAIKAISNVVGGRFTFHRGVGSQDQFGYAFTPHSIKQTLNPDLLRAHAIDGRQVPHQYEVTAFVIAGLLNGKQV